MDRSKAYKYFHALLGELGIRDRKADILSGYGVESTAELTDGQLLGLIHALEDEKRRRAAEREAREADIVRRRRSRILRLLTDIGVYYVEPGEPKDACWGRVNRFLSSPRIAGKVLYEMTVEELGRVERLLRSMHNKGYVYRREESAAPAREPSRPVVLVVSPTASGPVN